jgi:hypothetical protein
VNNQLIHIKAALRFRRFTRAAYAAFVSLSREISIGKLAVSIANSADKKVSGFFNEIESFLKIQNEEEDEQIFAETQTVDILLLQTQTVAKSAAACSVINRSKYNGG